MIVRLGRGPGDGLDQDLRPGERFCTWIGPPSDDVAYPGSNLSGYKMPISTALSKFPTQFQPLHTLVSLWERGIVCRRIVPYLTPSPSPQPSPIKGEGISCKTERPWPNIVKTLTLSYTMLSLAPANHCNKAGATCLAMKSPSIACAPRVTG